MGRHTRAPRSAGPTVHRRRSPPGDGQCQGHRLALSVQTNARAARTPRRSRRWTRGFPPGFLLPDRPRRTASAAGRASSRRGCGVEPSSTTRSASCSGSGTDRRCRRRAARAAAPADPGASQPTRPSVSSIRTEPHSRRCSERPCRHRPGLPAQAVRHDARHRPRAARQLLHRVHRPFRRGAGPPRDSWAACPGPRAGAEEQPVARPQRASGAASSRAAAAPRAVVAAAGSRSIRAACPAPS